MKKILFSMFAVAAMLFATSCSQEEELGTVVPGAEVEVSFSAQLPSIATRAYSDGTTANKLHYAVYAKESNVALFQDSVDIQGKKANVALNLANGMTYELIFWAQPSKATSYELNWDTKTMTVNYESLKANDEKNDAFYKYLEFTVDGTVNQKEVELTRPFAQINLGTSDFADAATAGLNADRSSMTAVVPTVLNFIDGSVEGEETVVFAVNEFKRDEVFPVDNDTYDYLCMNYVLTGTKTLIDKCTFNVWKAGEENPLITAIEVTNVPVQRNYRTNIYGALLTNPTDFKISVNSDFETPDENLNDYEAIAEGVKFNSKTETFMISNLAGLQWVADICESDVECEKVRYEPDLGWFAGQTVDLVNDIDLSSISNWSPIGVYSGTSERKNFAGTFDGNNHIISNLTVTHATNSGLFGYVVGTLKNVVLENATVTGNYKAGALVAEINGTVDNCHVDGGAVTSTVVNKDNANSVGGLVGLLSEGNNTLINSSVKDMTVKAYRDVAGLAGTATAGSQVKGNSVENVIVIANQLVEYNGVKPANAGEVVGRNLGATVEDNNTTNVKVNVLKVDESGTLEVGAGCLEAISTLNDENVKEVVFTDDVTGKAEANSGYGVTGISHRNGSTIDGSGNTLTVTGANTTWDSAIYTQGGTIKNLNIKGACRGIFIAYETEKVIIDNVTINPGAYTISVDGANGHGLEVSNSTINGWTSFSAQIGETMFSNCSFGSNGSYAYLRPYAKTVLKDCTFSVGYELDATQSDEITLENCKVGDTLITNENLSTLLGANAANAIVL